MCGHPVLAMTRDDLASVVHRALEPAHVSLWISQRDLVLAFAGSAAVKPGPSEVRLPYYAIICRDLHQQPHDHELQLPYLRHGQPSQVGDPHRLV